MDNAPVIVGLVVCAILVLVAVAMVARLACGIYAEHRERRRAESRKTTLFVAGIGELSSWDHRAWHGEVRGVRIELDSPGAAPTAIHASQVLTLLDRLPELVKQASRYIVNHEDVSPLAGGVERFEAYGIEWASADAFVLEMTHPADVDGVYRVEFQDGLPVSCGRDD